MRFYEAGILHKIFQEYPFKRFLRTIMNYFNFDRYFDEAVKLEKCSV